MRKWRQSDRTETKIPNKRNIRGAIKRDGESFSISIEINVGINCDAKWLWRLSLAETGNKIEIKLTQADKDCGQTNSCHYRSDKSNRFAVLLATKDIKYVRHSVATRSTQAIKHRTVCARFVR